MAMLGWREPCGHVDRQSPRWLCSGHGHRPRPRDWDWCVWGHRGAAPCLSWATLNRLQSELCNRLLHIHVARLPPLSAQPTSSLSLSGVVLENVRDTSVMGESQSLSPAEGELRQASSISLAVGLGVEVWSEPETRESSPGQSGQEL